MSGPLLAVEGLTVRYHTREGEVSAVEDVSFILNRGDALGLVGESGSGKTTVANSLLKLLPDNARLVAGHIYLDGDDLVPKTDAQMRSVRWDRISMIFQAAMSSLDPVYRIGDQIAEAIEAHENVPQAELSPRIRDLLEMAGLDRSLADKYPHELSGGMRQRVVIAMALACDPDVLIADEPTTALDVIVQDQVLRELRQVRSRLGMAMIYISHDIAVVAETSDRIGVMYAGKLVELGGAVEIFNRPIHPYTEALLSAAPNVRGERRDLATLPGESPNLIHPPAGCRFHPRCAYATDLCRREEPPIISRGTHWAACWNPIEQSR